MHDEGGLGEIVLGGDRLQDRVLQPISEEANARRITGEEAASEGVDLVVRDAHGGVSRLQLVS